MEAINATAHQCNRPIDRWFDRFLNPNKALIEKTRSFTFTLSNLPRETQIAKANQNAQLIKAKKFIGSLPKKLREEKSVVECTKEIAAFRLGISAHLFDNGQNPGFYAFTQSPPLTYYLQLYGDRLKVDETSGEIQIKMNHILTPWSQVQAALEAQPKAPEKIDRPKQPWSYDSSGVVQKDMYDWSELQPFKVEPNHSWGNRYLFEICTTGGERPRANGDHTWIRLKTPKGEIYSVGLYRPGKPNLPWDNFRFPFRIRPGYLMQPDFSEFWPEPITALPFEITEEHFHQIKEKLEETKRNEEQLTFQAFGENCTLFSSSLAKIAGIDLPTGKPIRRLITPQKLEPLADALDRTLPRLIIKTSTVAIDIFINFLLYALGGGHVDRKVKEHCPDKKGYYGSVLEIFDPSKAVIHHPNTVGFTLFNRLKQWRSEDSDPEEIEKRRYAIPPDWKK